MRIVESLRAHPWLATAAAGALVGCVIGLFLPIRAASPSKAAEAKWALPTAASIKRFDENKYQALRSAAFWGEIKAPDQRGGQTSNWSLSGIVTRPAIRIAVTNTTGKPTLQWVSPGGKLPDGGIFVAANRDTAWYDRDGCRRARKLYAKPAAAGDACIGEKKAEPAISPASSPARKPL